MQLQVLSREGAKFDVMELDERKDGDAIQVSPTSSTLMYGVVRDLFFNSLLSIGSCFFHVLYSNELAVTYV